MIVDEDILEIDQHRLDEEWSDQPKLYMKFSKALADANKSVDETKAELSVVQAELDADIRLRPDNYNVVKVTEATVYNAILLQPRYREVQEKLIEDRHLANLLSGMVDALDHRKRALENLVYLHGQAYFSSPTVRQQEEKKNVRNRSTRTKE
jgi:ribosomal protein L4